MRNIRFLSAMKKGVVALALTLCIATGSGFASNAEEKGTVTVEAGKIRASADTGSEQVGSVAKGGNVDIISKTTGADGKTWYQVYLDDINKNGTIENYINYKIITLINQLIPYSMTYTWRILS